MRILLAVPALLLAGTVQAKPFDGCPTKAYLTQGSVPGTYAMNLVTGDYQVAARNMGSKRSVNALGFNPNDSYIYGWSYQHESPARVHKDFSIEPLELDDDPDMNFYAGDVSSLENKYYVYRPGSKGGLFYIDLNNLSTDNDLELVKVVDGGTLNINIADMAFHPTTPMAYGADQNGDLFEINAQAGSAIKLGNIGQTGLFGAAYFDSEGNLYLGRNNDGNIYKVAIDAGDYNAQFFAKGPASSVNDGSRCAQAPLSDISNTNLDFGDAPDTYGTTLASNGPRHALSGKNSYYLGNHVDGESDASVHPLADETNGKKHDDDGVQFATNIVESSNAIAKIKTSKRGYLSAWIDLDRNGEFDGNDQVLTDVETRPGKQYVYIPIPAGVIAGESWARFRFSSVSGLESMGGAPDGEVEDYKVELVEKAATVTTYPSSKGYTTIAFEDNWPHEGDYDMNDLVVHMRTAVLSKPSGVTQVNMKGAVSAVGAAYHNGFAVRLPGVKRDQVDVDNVEYTINGKEVNFQPLEGGRDEAIFIITYNLWDYVGSGEQCKYYRTEPGCGSDIQMQFNARIPMKSPVDVELRGSFDPFLFATPGAWHGGHFMTAPGRSYEIHMKNRAPTEAFDHSLFDEPGDDVSDSGNDLYYQTSKGLPWAMEIGSHWTHPQEYKDIGHAYPYFADWAETNGTINRGWYLKRYANTDLLFDN